MFSRIVGHNNIKDYFYQLLKNERFHTSYIFYGLKGIGKRKLADAIAKTLLCENRTTNSSYLTPCEHCLSCRNFHSKQVQFYYDLIQLFTQEKTFRKDISMVTFLGELKNSLFLKPSVNSHARKQFRIIIIDPVETLSLEALNSILKILEEPPANVIFFFICENLLNVLPTIRSRSQIIRFNPLTQPEFENTLKQINVILTSVQNNTNLRKYIENCYDISNLNSLLELKFDIKTSSEQSAHPLDISDFISTLPLGTLANTIDFLLHNKVNLDTEINFLYEFSMGSPGIALLSIYNNFFDFYEELSKLFLNSLNVSKNELELQKQIILLNSFLYRKILEISQRFQGNKELNKTNLNQFFKLLLYFFRKSLFLNTSDINRYITSSEKIFQTIRYINNNVNLDNAVFELSMNLAAINLNNI